MAAPRAISLTIGRMHKDEQELRTRLNAETGTIEWAGLERHFARGSVVKVSASLDLLEVAARMVRDDASAIRDWIADGALARATDADARAWGERRPVFWAVVAAPWVLVQEVDAGDSREARPRAI